MAQYVPVGIGCSGLSLDMSLGGTVMTGGGAAGAAAGACAGAAASGGAADAVCAGPP
ncbi:MAG: hypothetical protein GXP07_18225, partial [Betaproteobacteria bacterium]|nr:hypothetical protein [Betaproteobacteria bacterium]